jgi:beta-glucosidase
MNRADFLKTFGTGVTGLYLSGWLAEAFQSDPELTKLMFGSSFQWGITTSAFQTEGAWNTDGKGESIWDRFTHEHVSRIKDRSNADISTDFYHYYKNDISLINDLNFKNFRFSVSWPRVMPDGTGRINEKGIDFYNNVIDTCLENGITPWLTLYHWDLPQKLEDKGGWKSRDIVEWFSDYTNLCTRRFGDRVKNWIVINEPAAITLLGYFTGIHAPGHRGLNSFLSSVHNLMLAMAEGGRVIRSNVINARIGNALSCSYVEPYKLMPKHEKAAKRIDVLLNRMFIEPTLGMGYPVNDLPFLKKIEHFIHPGDEERLKFDFDFIGLQNYFRVIGKAGIVPYIWANQVKNHDKNTEFTQMGWEVYPEGLYEIIKQFSKYPVKEIIITENGAAFNDHLNAGSVQDTERVKFFKSYIRSVLKAKNEGVNISGYFIWTLIDNFEWTYGYIPKFGIIYNDFKTQQRIIKNSGRWFQEFLK